MTMLSKPPNSSRIEPDPRAEALVASYTRGAGNPYVRIAPPVLQPAEPFLDLGGEDIRSRMFLTTDPEGRELCLRPDLTIPVSCDYLASPEAGKPAGFCYLGPVFRHREGAAAEFLQVGIESFGRQDKAAADAEMLALGLEATKQYGVQAPEIRMGDFALFAAFIDAHDLDELTLAPANGSKEYQGVLAALNGSDPKAAHHLVTDLLSIAGIATVGGRSVAEIADRFLEQSAINAPTRLPRETRALIERFLSLQGDPDEAATELRKLAADAKITLGNALDLFETRTGFMVTRGVDVRAIKFSTGFGRHIDYYTGFVFELHDPRVKSALVAGGRYDDLLARLGAREQIPAVGFAAAIEDLIACGSEVRGGRA